MSYCPVQNHLGGIVLILANRQALVCRKGSKDLLSAPRDQKYSHGLVG